jgi:uncharacterized protein YqgC (DUF456 family)
MNETLLIGLTLFVMLIGVAGVLIPVLPDVWLIWLAALAYGLIAGFDGWSGGIAMTVLTLLAVAGVIADVLLSHAGAAESGASWQAIAASFVLGLVGLPLFPPIGSLVGAMLGLFGVEYLQNGRDVRRAWRAVTGYAAGCGVSVVARLGIALAMVLMWGLWVWVTRSG